MKSPEVWTEIPQDEIDSWNARLLKTDGSYRQYPYWNEPYAIKRFHPRYLFFGAKEDPSAYVCIVTLGVGKFKLGLVQCGPVGLDSSRELDGSAFRSLAEWAARNGCAFLRFTNADPTILKSVASMGRVREIESFPFHRDPQNKLLVRQLENDDDVLASFQNVARYEIRAAIRAGYQIRASENVADLVSVWPMFETLADRKGFKLSFRPLAGWIEVFRMAQRHGCARLYTAWLEQDLVQAIFVLRYGSIAEYMLGALDVPKLKGKVSPSCLIHWRAMRDFQALGCEYYNLGGPGNKNQVYQFKRKFHPKLSSNHPPVTLVLNERLYALWSNLVLRTFLPWRSRARRVLSRYIRRPEPFDGLSAAK